MDKRQILKQLAEQIATDLEILTEAAFAAHEAATHAESKAEDQYDTRGLEASYLAGAQSKRVVELEDLLALYVHIDVRSFGPETPVAATALIELESDGKVFFYLLMPSGGGRSTTINGNTISVITPQAPMGEALLGKRIGDEVQVDIQRTTRDYEIKRVW